MSLVDDLRALPAGVGAHMADRVEQAQATRPEALTAIATALRDSATAAEGALAPVGPAVAGLTGAWDGASADAFTAYAGSVDAARVVLGDTAVDAADAVDALVTALEAADTTITGLGESFLSAANAELAAYPSALPEQVVPAIRAVTAGFDADTDAAVVVVESAIGTAQAALHGLAPLPTPFTALPPPGTAGFAPAPGVPIDWTPIPDPAEPVAPAPTSPAGGAAVTPPGGAAPAVPPPAAAAVPPPAAGPDGGAPSGPVSAGGGGGSGAAGGGAGAGSGGQGDGPARHGFGGGSPDGGSSGDAPAGTGTSGGPPATMPPGEVESWIREAIRILRETGHPVSEVDLPAIWSIISHESGGDPNAINLWDSNAEKGIPSKGVMQTIDPTFDAYRLPGRTDIWNPVDNIIAGVRYTIDRYGSLAQHPGLASLAAGGGYLPY